jgi:hypothetical protein
VIVFSGSSHLFLLRLHWVSAVPLPERWPGKKKEKNVFVEFATSTTCVLKAVAHICSLFRNLAAAPLPEHPTQFIAI